MVPFKVTVQPYGDLFRRSRSCHMWLMSKTVLNLLLTISFSNGRYSPSLSTYFKLILSLLYYPHLLNWLRTLLSTCSVTTPLSYYNTSPPSDPPSLRGTDVQLIAVRVIVIFCQALNSHATINSVSPLERLMKFWNVESQVSELKTLNYTKQIVITTNKI